MVQKLTDEQAKFFQIFHGYALRKQLEIESKKGRFVHYTSAEAASRMFQNKRLWMRNSQTMNDFSEIHHGLDCLSRTYASPTGKRFKAAISDIFPDILPELEKRLDRWIPEFRHNTYLASLSEHDDTEDNYGRLSMWRAYGNVAIVLNRHVFLTPSDAINAYASPVAYMDQPEFEVEFLKVAKRSRKRPLSSLRMTGR